jgi:hypothetical protein
MKESFVFATSNRIDGDQIKDNKLAREHGMECLKETDCLDDLDMEGEDIIKMDLTEYGLD